MGDSDSRLTSGKSTELDYEFQNSRPGFVMLKKKVVFWIYTDMFSEKLTYLTSPYVYSIHDFCKHDLYKLKVNEIWENKF